MSDATFTGIGPGVSYQYSARNQREGLGFPPGLVERLKNLAPATAKWPAIMRQGPGSLAEQIQRRAFMDQTGASTLWREPAYAQGKPLPIRAAAGEKIMWSAALGLGPGSITRSDAHGAAIGVDDTVVRALAAHLGNQLVSSASYFPFVTGSFSQRRTDGFAKPVKCTNPTKKPRAARGTATYRVGRWSKYGSQFAMWWFLGLTYDYWATEAELRAGIATPPKNLGISKPMLARARQALADYVIGASRLQQGAASDPRSI